MTSAGPHIESRPGKQIRKQNKIKIDVTLDVDVKLRNRRPTVFTSYKFLDKVEFFLFLLTF